MSHTQSKYDWSAFIKMLRGEEFLGFSQEELARVLEASLRAVSKWETGKSTPLNKFRKKLMNLAVREGFQRDLWPRLERQRPRAVSSKPAHQ